MPRVPETRARTSRRHQAAVTILCGLLAAVLLLSPTGGGVLYAGSHASPAPPPTPAPAALLQAFDDALGFLADRERALGSEGLEEAVTFVAGRLEAQGLQVHEHRYPVLAPAYSAHVLALEDGTRLPVYPLLPNGPVLASPPDGVLTGPVHYARDGSREAMMGVDWQGSLAVLEALPETQWLRPFELGAEAVILLPPPEDGTGQEASAGDGEDGVLSPPAQFPFLHLPADLPRFTVTSGDAARLRAALAGPGAVSGTLTGSGRWVEVGAPHLTAVIPGDPAVVDGDVLVVHAELGQSEFAGGVTAAGEATSAALLLALAERWAVEPPPQPVMLSFGSGGSRAFHSLRHWLDGQAAPAELGLFVGLDLGEGGQAAAAVSNRSEVWKLLAGRGIAGVPDEEALAQLEVGGRVEVPPFAGGNRPMPADPARWRGAPVVIVTTDGERHHLGGPDDVAGSLDLPLLHERIGEFLFILDSVTARPWTGSSHEAAVVQACLETGMLAGQSEPGSRAWTAGVIRWPAGLLPLVQPPDADGCIRFAGFTRFGFGGEFRAADLQIHAFRLDADGLVAAGPRERPARAERSQEDSLLYATDVPLMPGRVVTLVGWPGPVIHGQWQPGEPFTLATAAATRFSAQAWTHLTTAALLDARSGQPTGEAYLEELGPVATLLAPAGRELVLERAPILTPFRAGGGERTVLEPDLHLRLVIPDRPGRLQGRLAAAEFLYAASSDLLARLHTSGGRHPFLEGMTQLAGRELAAALHGLSQGDLLAFEQRLEEAYEELVATYAAVLRVQHAALVSLVVYLLLAMVAAAALGHFLAAGRPPRERAVLAVTAFAVLYASVRWFHPGYGMADVAPELATGAVLLAAGLAVLLVLVARRAELRLARRQRRLGERPDVDRYSLFLAAVGMGLSQLGRRRLRSSLTAVSLTLFVFALLAVGALTPTFQLQAQHLGGDPAYEGILVRAEDHAPLATRVPEDMAALVPNLGEPAAIRWSVAERVEDQEEPPPTHLQPNYVVEGDGDAGLFRTLLHAPAAYAELLGLGETLVAGSWLTGGSGEVLLPRSAAEGLWPDPLARVGEQVAIHYQYPVAIPPRDPVNPIEWVRGTSHHREATLVGIYDDAAYGAREGLDGRPLAPPGFGFGPGAQLIASPDIIADFAPRIVAWAAPTDGPPAQEHVRELASALPYAVYAGGEGVRYAMGTARPTVMRLALPMGVLAVMGLLLVVNTMLGAVYERRQEFRTLNVVGLAPHHIRSLVLTEGAVIGAVAVVLGWTLLLLTGGVLRHTPWQAELALNVNSFSLVALLLGMVVGTAAAAAVPAQRAARGAAPGGQEAMIPASDDSYRLELPFTVPARDVPALWAFLWPLFEPASNRATTFIPHEARWVAGGTDPADDALTMEVLLYPADAGVNQRVHLTAVPAAEAAAADGRRVQVAVERLSGQHAAWRRLNVALVAELRRQLLAWDLVDDEDRNEYRQEARALRRALGVERQGE